MINNILVSNKKVKIILSSDSEMEGWDDFVSNHPAGTPYHFFAWKKSVENAYNFKSYYLMAVSCASEVGRVEKSDIKGILPLIHIKPPISAGSMVSLPYCDVGGILTYSEDVEKLLINCSINLCKSLGIPNLEIRSTKHITSSWPCDINLEVQSHKVSMMLKFPNNSEDLWKSFKSKLRSQIRKPEKEGLTFSWRGLDYLNDFYELFSINMKSLGSPVHSKKWIRSVLHTSKKSARMGIVYHGTQPIGGGILLLCGKIIRIPWASTLRQYNNLSPNMLLYWNFLKYGADNGFEYFDFGRSSINEGTYRFKAQWGAKPNPLYWYIINSEPTKSGSNVKMPSLKQNFINVWQCLPLSFTNQFGPLIRKNISL